MSERMSSEQWADIEKKVNEAERAKREAEKVAQESGSAKRTGTKLTDIEKEVLAETQEEKRAEVEAALGYDGSTERALVSLRWKNLSKAIQTEHALQDERNELLAQESSILGRIDGVPTGTQTKALGKLREKLQENDENQEALIESSPEAYFGLHLRDLKEMRRDLENGRIVETPYVKKQAEDVATHLKAGVPVMIYGHLGTGKTELAMHVAKEYMGKEAVVLSGSKHTSLSELYGHQVLAVDEKSGATKSDFYLGPVYQAMKEGRIVIIDEVNAIPHEVLISLNHILTLKVGETVPVQQDSGETVAIKEGFGVIMTGNLNQGDSRYVDRQELDPAFLSRLYKLEHDYVPQQTEGTLDSEAGSDNELFQILLARMMDKHGNIEAPKDSIRKLWRLAQAARVTQDVFAGRQVKDAYYFKQGGARATQYSLKESVLSLRAMDKIVSMWQRDGYKNELDHYIHSELVSQSTNAADKAYLYQQFKDQFGFFQGGGWDQSPDYGSGGMVKSFDVKSPANRGAAAQFLGPRQIVEAAYGKAPERAEWPDLNAAAEVGDAERGEVSADLLAMDEFRSMLGCELGEIGREVETMCRI